MKHIPFYLIIFILLFDSCSSSTNEKWLRNITLDHLSFTAKTSKANHVTNVLKAIKKSRYVIVNLTQHSKYTDEHYKFFTKDCNNWTLTHLKTKKIINNSVLIDGIQLHDYYSVFPCFYTAKMVFPEDTINVTIEGGGQTTLDLKDTSILLGYKGFDKTLFISLPDYGR